MINQIENKPEKNHTLVLENRNLLKLTGIQKTINYDEYSVTVDTDVGTLLIGGSNLTVNEISVHSGDVNIQGNIEYIQYQTKRAKAKGAGGFLKRLVR